MRKGRKKKKEVMMEFFLTYGWALLVILVGFGLLVYFGLINIEGSTCKIAPKIKCKELNIEYNKIVLTVENSMDELLLGVDLGVNGCDNMDTGNILDKGKEETFIVTGCNYKVGDMVDTELNFTYVTEDGQQQKKIGKIKGTVI